MHGLLLLYCCCSYNAAYGQPTCASHKMNHQMVRSDWGWDGFFVSDCTALELMQDVKWDSCQPPYSPGNCTPAPFRGACANQSFLQRAAPHAHHHACQRTVSYKAYLILVRARPFACLT